MNRIEQAAAEILADFDKAEDNSVYPEALTDAYDIMECLTQGHGTKTFLVREKAGSKSFVAKCYDKGLYSTVHEGDILKGLCHQGLPAYEGQYENDSIICVVREFIEGMPLDKYVVENPLTAGRIKSIGIELCRILEYLHGRERPIIHRDIKPQNVIIREDGHVVLIDFDIARTYDSEASADTQFMGTKKYAPPEQYGFTQTDWRADIYSLGMVLQFMGGDEDKTLKKIIDKCTAFAPKERYQTVTKVRHALSGEERRRKGVLVGLLTVVMIGAAVLGVWSQGVRFTEPLMEAAVRVQLGKTQGELITKDELLSVTGIYIFGKEVSIDDSEFVDGLSGDRKNLPRGDIQSIEDVKMLPNLKTLYVNYQELSDISPTAGLANLERVSLRHTEVSDLSPLAGCKKLESVEFYDTNVSDLSVLDGCTEINGIDPGGSNITRISQLTGFERVRSLGLKDLYLDSLEGIERFQRLTYLNLRGTKVDSLKPLLKVKFLETVELDESLRPLAEEISKEAKFEIVYSAEAK